MPWSFYPLSTAPASCDIVWCRFPLEGIPGPGPKSRPGIVRQSFADEDGNPLVSVVFGTTKMRMGSHSGDFVIANLGELDAAGLFRATRFDLGKCALLPWCAEFFEARVGFQSPVIGRLTGHGIHMLQVTLAYRQLREQRELEKAAVRAFDAGDPPAE